MPSRVRTSANAVLMKPFITVPQPDPQHMETSAIDTHATFTQTQSLSLTPSLSPWEQCACICLSSLECVGVLGHRVPSAARLL